MKILITGSDGFVGTEYVKKLSSPENHIVKIDIKSGNDCRDYFKTDQSKFDLIIHLAAIVGGRETIENDPLSVASDLAIDSDFFNWVLKTDQDCPIIYFSSSAAYPIKFQQRGSGVRMSEGLINLSDIQSPDFTYGWSKLSGEYLASFVKEAGKKVHIFRPFSGYGETQSLDYPFPSFINRAINAKEEFEIWGDGTQVRDFIHIEDIIESTLKAVELELLEPINLGWGEPISFNNLAQKVFKVSGYTPKNGIKHLLQKPVGVYYRCSDASLMKSFYKPKITLEEGIERAILYQRSM